MLRPGGPGGAHGAAGDGARRTVPSLARMSRPRRLAVTAFALLASWAALAPGARADGHAPVWLELATCESSNRWKTNTGNGFYGGLQIFQPTWVEHGGLDLAARPDRATPDQQMTVAEEILRDQGWEAWPTCAQRLRLAGRAHAVQSGETLEGVARRFNVSGGAAELYRLNQDVIGSDPTRQLTPGTLLRLPR